MNDYMTNCMSDGGLSDDSAVSVAKISVIGAGNMGGALIRGFHKTLPKTPCGRRTEVLVYDVRPDLVHGYVNDYGVRALTCLREAAEGDVIFLALKPGDMRAVASELAIALEDGRERVLVSIAAGVRLCVLEEVMPSSVHLVRVMPNLPCTVGEGMSVVYSDHEPSRRVVSKLLVGTGAVEQIQDEELFDVVTALSGSGPGYLFLVIEALADGAVKQGLSRKLATRLAAQTVKGAGSMLMCENVSPGELRERVASPGGTTIAGLMELEDSAVRAAFMRAVEAATFRSKELL